jgi:ATP-dependent Lon protease
MRSEDMETEPPGFIKVQKIICSPEDGRHYKFAIYLPEPLGERIEHAEKIRQDKALQNLRDKKSKEVSQPAEAPCSVMQRPFDEAAKPEAAISAKTLAPGVNYDPQREHLIHASDAPAQALERAKLTADDGLNARDLVVLTQLKNRGPLRKIINPVLLDPGLASFDKLVGIHPHFGEVIEFVRSQVVLSRMSAKPLRIPPILLFGGPGLGKSHFTRDLAHALGTVCRLVSMDGSVSNASLVGLDRKWGNSAPGVLFDLLCRGDCANPVVLLDELDKVGRSSKDDPLAPLHSLLEPSTSARVRDASMSFEFDASLVTWIATANQVVFLPTSLRSRFREFRIDHPNAEQAITLAYSVTNSVIEKTAPEGFSLPKRAVILKLAHLTAREIYQVVEQAIGKAVLNQRAKIELRDLPVELIQLDADSGSTHSGGMGYVH